MLKTKTNPAGTDRIDPETAWLPFEPSRGNPWNIRLAAHLYRRAAFGGTVTQIKQSVESGLKETLDNLFDFSSAEKFDQQMESSARVVSTGADSQGLAAWWLLRMAQTPAPLQEKLTLFWHGHFATGGEKVLNARAMLHQNNLLRMHCKGEFKPLVREISRDPAMLIYLDSVDNRKTRPNENYARELMELFCLGIGNYTEQDIKEVARCFTGREIKRSKFHFNRYQHDEGVKTFLDGSGKFDGDDAIDVILDQPSCARFIAKKLIRFFVADDLEISDDLARPVAQQLRETNYRIEDALRMILSSRLFFSGHAIGRKIKSPTALAIGFLRFFGATTNMNTLARRLAGLGQLPLFPPGVKGWDGGRTWINASTVLARTNLISELLFSRDTGYGDGDLREWRKSNDVADVAGLCGYQLAVDLPEGVFDRLVKEPGQWKAKPDAVCAWLAAQPEFQLC